MLLLGCVFLPGSGATLLPPRGRPPSRTLHTGPPPDPLAASVLFARRSLASYEDVLAHFERNVPAAQGGPVQDVPLSRIMKVPALNWTTIYGLFFAFGMLSLESLILLPAAGEISLALLLTP